jgi:hypothetical protein
MKIYFHRSCFDGVASAAMAAWLFESSRDEYSFEFEPVDYRLRTGWERASLGDGACVVDFLYHPKANYWWDHHATTFVSVDSRDSYQRRRSPSVMWDPNAPSCAGLILRYVREHGLVPPNLEDMGRWADKLDAAQYESPEDAVLNLSSARLIALSFVVEDTHNYYDFLIRNLIKMPVEEVALTPSCRQYCDEAQRRYILGLELFRKKSSFDDGIVSYDVTVGHEIVDRMMPYFLFPQADYSLGIVRSADRRIKLTCNASPWRRPSGPHLGELFARHGGGGHHDVGSALYSEDGKDLALALGAITRTLRQPPDRSITTTQA